jgi:uncharacterized membrane protein
MVMHVILVFSALPLFTGALLSTWAYAGSYQVQWTNFASWLVAGGLVLVGLALLWALVDVLTRSAAGRRRPWPYLVALLLGFGLGFVNALILARDAWAAMPAGMWLSALALLALVCAGVLGWAGWREGVAR